MASNESLSAYWSFSTERLLSVLDSTPSGLAAAEARARLKRAGPNNLAEGRRLGAWPPLFDQLRNPLVLILLFAAVVHDWFDETRASGR